MRRVVITGAGTVNALARDVPGTLQAFRDGRCGIGPITVRDGERLTIKIGAQVPDWSPEAEFSAAELPLYDRFTQFAVFAAREAMAAAGLGAALGSRAGAILGSAGAASAPGKTAIARSLPKAATGCRRWSCHG